MYVEIFRAAQEAVQAADAKPGPSFHGSAIVDGIQAITWAGSAHATGQISLYREPDNPAKYHEEIALANGIAAPALYDLLRDLAVAELEEGDAD